MTPRDGRAYKRRGTRKKGLRGVDADGLVVQVNKIHKKTKRSSILTGNPISKGEHMQVGKYNIVICDAAVVCVIRKAQTDYHCLLHRDRT